MPTPTDRPVVIRDVAPNDEMYQGDDDHYFGVGRSALACIRQGLAAAGVPDGSVRRVLDLPCGHGRVLRQLRAAFPWAELVACDLRREGVDFCARTFGAVPVYAAADPRETPVLDAAFDLVWVGSLLTHLDAGRWGAFLDQFARVLRPGGVLVVTTHGHAAFDWTMDVGVAAFGLPAEWADGIRSSFEQTGFGYADYPATAGYGLSFSTPDWVRARLARVPGLRLVHVAERGWDDYQDVFALVGVATRP